MRRKEEKSRVKMGVEKVGHWERRETEVKEGREGRREVS